MARKSAQFNIDWVDFKEWLSHRYAKSHAPSILSYCKRYSHIVFGAIRDVDRLSPKSKNNVVKALIVLSKYLGIHDQFKASLKNYGVKLFSADAFSSFLRVYNNSNSDLMKWVQETSAALRPSEKLYLQFLRVSGLRKEEGIISFNKIIELSKRGALGEYYNEERSLLEHFKYKEQFLEEQKTCTSQFCPDI